MSPKDVGQQFYFVKTYPRLLEHDQYSIAVGSITPSTRLHFFMLIPSLTACVLAHNQICGGPLPTIKFKLKTNKQTRQNKDRDPQIANADRGGLKESCQVEERKTKVKSMNPKTPRYTLEFSVTIDVQTTPFFLSALSPPKKVNESLHLLQVIYNLFCICYGSIFELD